MATTSRSSTRWLIAGAVIFFAAFFTIGALVSPVPPYPHDAMVSAFFFGQATPLAAAITTAGTFPFYAALSIIALVAGFLRRAWLPRAALAVGTLIIAWQVSDVFKALFDRPRPPQWLVFHETSASYPSGHATLVTAFWGVWAMYLIMGPRSNARIAGLVAIVAWILAIGWSRMALGAHYVSDVIGGYLLGLSFVYIAATVARFLEARTARSSAAN